MLTFTAETETKLPRSTIAYQSPHQDQNMSSIPKTIESRVPQPKSERKHLSWGAGQTGEPPTPKKRILYGVDGGERPGVGIRQHPHAVVKFEPMLIEMGIPLQMWISTWSYSRKDKGRYLFRRAAKHREAAPRTNRRPL